MGGGTNHTNLTGIVSPCTNDTVSRATVRTLASGKLRTRRRRGSSGSSVCRTTAHKASPGDTELPLAFPLPPTLGSSSSTLSSASSWDRKPNACGGLGSTMRSRYSWHDAGVSPAFPLPDMEPTRGTYPLRSLSWPWASLGPSVSPSPWPASPLHRSPRLTALGPATAGRKTLRP